MGRVEAGKKILQVHEFQDGKSLAQALSKEIASILAKKLAERGASGLVVSGGKTPRALFERLSNEDIDWSRVHVTLADERWVSPESSQSNQALVERHLLRNRARDARFIGLYTGAKTARDGETECEKRLLDAKFPIDVVVLGMGTDGHTASLFPGAKGLFEAVDLKAERLCKAIVPTSAPHERMTLTLKALTKTDDIFLHITGKEKRQVLEKALSGDDPWQMPIRFVFKYASSPVKVFWTP